MLPRKARHLEQRLSQRLVQKPRVGTNQKSLCTERAIFLLRCVTIPAHREAAIMTYGLNMGLPVSAQLKYWGIATAVLFGALWFLGDILMPFLLGGAVAYFLDPVAERLVRLGLSRERHSGVYRLCFSGDPHVGTTGGGAV
jgi:hypothetical protein